MNISNGLQKLWRPIIKLFKSQRYCLGSLLFMFGEKITCYLSRCFLPICASRFIWRRLPGPLHSLRSGPSMHTRRHETKSSVYCACVPPSWTSSVWPMRTPSLERMTLSLCSSLSSYGYVCYCHMLCLEKQLSWSHIDWFLEMWNKNNSEGLHCKSMHHKDCCLLTCADVLLHIYIFMIVNRAALREVLSAANVGPSHLLLPSRQTRPACCPPFSTSIISMPAGWVGRSAIGGCSSPRLWNSLRPSTIASEAEQPPVWADCGGRSRETWRLPKQLLPLHSF